MLILLFADAVFSKPQIFMTLFKTWERMITIVIRIMQLVTFKKVKKFTVFLYLRAIFLIIAADILG